MLKHINNYFCQPFCVVSLYFIAEAKVISEICEISHNNINSFDCKLSLVVSYRMFLAAVVQKMAEE